MIVDESEQQKYLGVLLLLKENQKCVDCDTVSPRWCSVTLGVFLCLKCSGNHRHLGANISRVRSVDLDTWTEEQMR